MRLRLIPLVTIGMAIFFAACNSNPTPDQIRKDTARDTATLKQDTQAVAEGVKEGLTNKKVIDLNKSFERGFANFTGNRWA
jgi:hypothetical protein